LPQPLPLCSSLYLLSFAPGLLSSLPSLGFWRENLELGLWPGLSSGRALTWALAPTLGCARALLRPGPVVLLQFKLSAQGQGFGHHLPCLPSAKLIARASPWPLLLAHASRWPLLLAPTSRQSIPTANSLPLALVQPGPSSGLALPFVCALIFSYTKPFPR